MMESLRQFAGRFNSRFGKRQSASRAWGLVGSCFWYALKWGEFCLFNRVSQAGRECQNKTTLQYCVLVQTTEYRYEATLSRQAGIPYTCMKRNVTASLFLSHPFFGLQFSSQAPESPNNQVSDRCNAAANKALVNLRSTFHFLSLHNRDHCGLRKMLVQRRQVLEVGNVLH